MEVGILSINLNLFSTLIPKQGNGGNLKLLDKRLSLSGIIQPFLFKQYPQQSTLYLEEKALLFQKEVQEDSENILIILDIWIQSICNGLKSQLKMHISKQLFSQNQENTLQ